MFHPSRGGVRGGRDQFKWEDVKNDTKHRENYLGHSIMAPVGRWQQGRDLQWYTKAGGPDAATDDEMAKIKAAEEDMMLVALGKKKLDRQDQDVHRTKEELSRIMSNLKEDEDEYDKERAAADTAGSGLGTSSRNRLVPQTNSATHAVLPGNVHERPPRPEYPSDSLTGSRPEESDDGQKTKRKKKEKQKKKHKEEKERSRRHHRSRSRSRSPPRSSRHRSRSRSPPYRRHPRSPSPSYRRRSRSPSPPHRRRSRSPSPPPRHRYDRSPGPRYPSRSPAGRRRYRSRSPLPPTRRSPTPPPSRHRGDGYNAHRHHY